MDKAMSARGREKISKDREAKVMERIRRTKHT